MRPLLLILPLAGLFAQPPARFEAQRTRSDFDLTLDPQDRNWRRAKPLRAEVDPFGKPSPAAYDTRILWSDRYLYLLFTYPYDSLYLKPNPTTTEETYGMWDWDAAELFIGGDFDNIYRYREFEVSPQGEWVDLDIDRKNLQAGAAWKWNSGFKVKANIDVEKKVWSAAMKIPLASIDSRPARAGNEYRMNIYRLSGRNPNRLSTMWTPTMSRSHHTPEKFGILVLGR